MLTPKDNLLVLGYVVPPPTPMTMLSSVYLNLQRSVERHLCCTLLSYRLGVEYHVPFSVDPDAPHIPLTEHFSPRVNLCCFHICILLFLAPCLLLSREFVLEVCLKKLLLRNPSFSQNTLPLSHPCNERDKQCLHGSHALRQGH